MKKILGMTFEEVDIPEDLQELLANEWRREKMLEAGC